jgi:hypothetical protein
VLGLVEITDGQHDLIGHWPSAVSIATSMPVPMASPTAARARAGRR